MISRQFQGRILVAALVLWSMTAVGAGVSFGNPSRSKSSPSSSSSRKSSSKSSANKASKAPAKIVAKPVQPVDVAAGQPTGWFARLKRFFGIGSNRSRAAPAARGSVRGIADGGNLPDAAVDADNANPVRRALQRTSSDMVLDDPSEPGPVVVPFNPRSSIGQGPEGNIYNNIGLGIAGGGGLQKSGEYGEPNSSNNGLGSRDRVYDGVDAPIAGEIAAAAANVAARKPYDNLNELGKSLGGQQSEGRSSSRQRLRNSASSRQPRPATIEIVSSLPLPPVPESARASVVLRPSGRSSNAALPELPVPLPPLPHGSGYSDIQ